MRRQRAAGNASPNRALCTFSAVTFVILLTAAAAIAQDTQLRILSKNATYDDVRFELQNAIIDRGLKIDTNGQVGKMLERTGADVGSSRQIYRNAEYFAFCSAKLSRAAMEADPENIGFCPYVIFIYETAAMPGIIHVGYRQLPPDNSVASQTARTAIEKLLNEIAKQAVQ
jgi:uncharacterized protein (DUF302 family)